MLKHRFLDLTGFLIVRLESSWRIFISSKFLGAFQGRHFKHNFFRLRLKYEFLTEVSPSLLVDSDILLHISSVFLFFLFHDINSFFFIHIQNTLALFAMSDKAMILTLLFSRFLSITINRGIHHVLNN